MKAKALEFDFGQRFFDEVCQTTTNDAGELLMPEVAEIIIVEMKKDIVCQLWVHLCRCEPTIKIFESYMCTFVFIFEWFI